MTYDNSHDGGSNGSGGRFNDSVQQIIDQQTAETAIRAKAAADPRSLTEEDLKIMPGDLASELMSRGELAHLGLGRPRRGRRR